MKILKFLVSVIFIIANIGFSNVQAQQNLPEKNFKNPTEEFQYYYKLANDYTIKEAQFKLGQFYETGYGTKKDILRAYVYYQYAASHKVKGADKALKKLIATMDGKQIAEAKKLYNEITDKKLDQMFSDLQSVD